MEQLISGAMRERSTEGTSRVRDFVEKRPSRWPSPASLATKKTSIFQMASS